MNLKHLYFFRELAHTEHMAKAAENLSISQPSLSYAITHLEKELGVPLFEKEGRNIKLTEAGKLYLNYVEDSLSKLNEGKNIISQLNDIKQGHIKIGFTYTLGQRLIPEVVTSFLKKGENRSITFSFHQNNTEELTKNLLNEKYNMIFSSYISKLGNENIQQELLYKKIANQELFLITPKDHPLSKYNSLSLHQIKKYPFINFSKESGLRPLIDNLFEDNNVHPNVKAEIEEDHTIVGFVKYGYGIAIIPSLPQLNSAFIHVAHITDKGALHPIYLITKANYYLSPSATKFKTFSEQYCQKNFLTI